MGARGERKGARRAYPFDFHIPGLVGSVGHFGGGGVRQAAHGLFESRLDSALQRLAVAQTVAQRGDFGDEAGGVFASRLGGADALRRGVAFGAQRLRGGDGVAALAVEGEEFARRGAVAAPGHGGVESRRVGAHGRDVEHLPSLA